jgi:hypothetical protein
MHIEFEATNSFCYRFARYVALPEILKEPEVVLGEPFRLIDTARVVIDRHLSSSQLSQKFIRRESGAPAGIGHTIRFYIPFLAKNLGMLTRLGAGMYSLPSAEDISGEAPMPQSLTKRSCRLTWGRTKTERAACMPTPSP